VGRETSGDHAPIGSAGGTPRMGVRCGALSTLGG
jgi:hypothetical protein